MYPGKHAVSRAAQPAVVMAGTGETIAYGGKSRSQCSAPSRVAS